MSCWSKREAGQAGELDLTCVIHRNAILSRWAFICKNYCSMTTVALLRCRNQEYVVVCASTHPSAVYRAWPAGPNLFCRQDRVAVMINHARIIPRRNKAGVPLKASHCAWLSETTREMARILCAAPTSNREPPVIHEAGSLSPWRGRLTFLILRAGGA